MWSTSKTLGKTFTVVVFEVFETGVELNAVDDFFPVTEGLEFIYFIYSFIIFPQ